MTGLDVTLTCPHGMKVEVREEADYPARFLPDAWRLMIRNTLLACPRCRAEAAAYIEETGA